MPPVNSVAVERLGSDYGGWWIPSKMLNEKSVVYSAGIGGDVTFDLELMDRYGCRVWGFDPTPFSQEFIRTKPMPPQWTFVPYGIWTQEKKLSFSPPAGQVSGSASLTRRGNSAASFVAQCVPIPKIMKDLDHSRIDLLKMDIEGAEGPVIDSVLETKIRPRIMCIEFDQPEMPHHLIRRIKRIQDAGYAVIKHEHWNVTFVLSTELVNSSSR